VSDQPITEPESDQPETEQPGTEQPGTEQPQADEPEIGETDTGEPETAESNGAVAPAKQAAAPTATAVLTHVVRSIVDDADAVKVDAVETRNRLKLEVKVGPGDLGRVIGRRGRTAQSIRTVVRAAATRDGVEVDVDFVD